MARQRITVLTASGTDWAPGMTAYLIGVGPVQVESVEDALEPIVQEFRVRVTSPSGLNPFPKSSVARVLRAAAHVQRAFTVTEVTP